jgi:hypothetical protein
MKINAFRNNDPKFTANLWRVKISTGAEGENHFSYTFNRAITLTANTGSFGKLDVWLPDDCADMVALDQLFNS